MALRIAALPGDGIGPEVTRAALGVLRAACAREGIAVQGEEHLVGGAALRATGSPLPDATVAACLSADAALLGAVGDPAFDGEPRERRPETGLLRLRKALGVFANVRPAKAAPGLAAAGPLKPEVAEGLDLVVYRELTGGLYFGEPRSLDLEAGRAVNTLPYSREEVERIAELAFRAAEGRRGLVTSVDKANVLESSRLWRQIATDIGKVNADVALDHMLVDTAAMRLVTGPAWLDVVVTENMFGDILTDEASVLAGSMGMLPSASIGEKGPGLYEPIHGSAPDIAGKGIANPVGTILSAAMLLRHSLDLPAEAAAIEAAVDRTITEGCRTADLGGKLTTREMAAEILKRLA